MSWSLRVFALVALTTVVASGCGDDDDGDDDVPAADAGDVDAPGGPAGGELAEAAVDATDVMVGEAGLLAIAVDDADVEGSGEDAAALARSRATTTFTPSACVTATGEGATVIYTLDDCAGPFGLAHVTGSVQVDYSVADGGGIAIHAVASNLAVSAATVDVDADGVYTKSGALRRLLIDSTGLATGPRGVVLAREGRYEVFWDEGAACLDLDGMWTTDVAGRSWTTTVAELTLCAGGCPQAGATVTFAGGIADVSVTVAFEGGTDASWMASTGPSGDLTLLCD
jgi:hypothetical protein